MATVKMIRGNKTADIFDSPETIAQAEKDGFERVVETKPAKTQAEVTDETPVASTPKTSRTKRQ